MVDIYHLFQNELDKHSKGYLRLYIIDQEERAEYCWLDLVVGGYIYAVVEGWVAGVHDMFSLLFWERYWSISDQKGIFPPRTKQDE